MKRSGNRATGRARRALLVLAGAVGVLLLGAACGGHGGALGAAAPGSSSPQAALPAPQLAGWSMPDLPGTVAPQPADPAAVAARLAQFNRPLPPDSRSTSGVIKTLPDDTLSVHGTYPALGYFDFRVSTPFDAQTPAEVDIKGNLSFGGPLTQRFVQLGLVNEATYDYAMDPDGNPLTNDANPSFLFNQNVVMVAALDSAGNPFAAGLDYNNSGGVGAPQAFAGNTLGFSLKLQPSGATGGQMSLSLNGGPFGPLHTYGQNNWGWMAAESMAQARLVAMVYSYNPDPAPFTVALSNVVADDPNYTPPNGGGSGNVQVDCTSLANAQFSVWNPTGPTPYTASLSTNTVFDGTGVLLDGDQFYLQFAPDPAMAPDDLAVYPPRPDGAAGGFCTVTPTGITLGGTLATWFTVPAGTRTLQLKPGAYNRITNDMAAGLPHALYTLKDTNALSTIGGPWETNASNVKHVVLANGVNYRPVFSSKLYPLAGSSAAHGGANETIYPAEWTLNWFAVGSGTITEGGSPISPDMSDFFTQAGLVNTMDSDAYVRADLTASGVVNPPYTLQLIPGFPNITPALGKAAQPLNVVTLARGLGFWQYRAFDSLGNATGSFTVDAGHKLSGGNSVNLTFGGGGGTLGLQVVPVRVYDDPDASDPDANVTGTDPWTVTLNFLLQYGSPNYTVELDADYGSAWNDGTPGRVYTVSGGPYTAPGTATGTANINNQSPGTYKFALRVTDAAGKQYVYVWPNSVTLTASGWTISQPNPDSAGLVGEYNSMAIVDGNPAMSYYDFGNSNLKYVRATDANGGNWGTPVTVDGAATDLGWFTSLAVINGNPAISYTGSIGLGPHRGGLYYIRATDADGTAWGSRVTLETNSWNTTSLLAVNGNPAIVGAYGDGNIYYIRATDANGTGWGSFIGLAGGDYPSLAIVNGNPAVGFYRNGDAGFVRATDANGGGWGGSISVDNGGGAADVGYYASLAVVNGNPAIAHYDDTNGDLRYVRATNASGTAWGTPQVLDTGGNTGAFGSLAVINGIPAIAYFDVTNGYLRYISGTDASGTAWNAPVTVDPNNGGGFNPLLLVNGEPGIGYYDGTNHDLKFVRYWP